MWGFGILSVVCLGMAFFMFTIAFAYGLGRRRGKREGVDEGLALAAIGLRETALQVGSCPICGYSAKGSRNDSCHSRAGICCD